MDLLIKKMSKIQILDCTLRDGGYVNNWMFGRKCISIISQKLIESSIEIVECGFLSQTKKCNGEQSIFNTIHDAERLITNSEKKYALMINCGEYDPNDLPQYSGGSVTTLRIAFHKHQLEEAKQLLIGCKQKGYRVFFQPMFTIGYSDYELLDLINFVNENEPEAVYIVDSFGTIRQNDLARIFYLIDHNLNPSIILGFHSHNNLQLSFSNAQKLISICKKREIIIDSSIFGMGRGAGNLCTELITQYINENIEDKYDLMPVLEIMDEYIMPIYSKNKWGYSAPYYIAAVNNCHPNYATYLMNLQTLCIRDISALIKTIPDKNRHLYDSSLIEKLYIEYQQHYVDDTALIDEIKQCCKARKILVLAPGKSLQTCREKINVYISRENPLVFAINHVPDSIDCDKIFISNMRRFKNNDDIAHINSSKLILTSNIQSGEIDNRVNYSSYLNDDVMITDNSGLMLINILKKCGVTKIALAGFDGFNYSETENYCDHKMISHSNRVKYSEINRSMMKYFNKLKKSVEISFITPTLYEDSSNDQI